MKDYQFNSHEHLLMAYKIYCDIVNQARATASFYDDSLYYICHSEISRLRRIIDRSKKTSAFLSAISKNTELVAEIRANYKVCPISAMQSSLKKIIEICKAEKDSWIHHQRSEKIQPELMFDFDETLSFALSGRDAKKDEDDPLLYAYHHTIMLGSERYAWDDSVTRESVILCAGIHSVSDNEKNGRMQKCLELLQTLLDATRERSVMSESLFECYKLATNPERGQQHAFELCSSQIQSVLFDSIFMLRKEFAHDKKAKFAYTVGMDFIEYIRRGDDHSILSHDHSNNLGHSSDYVCANLCELIYMSINAYKEAHMVYFFSSKLDPEPMTELCHLLVSVEACKNKIEIEKYNALKRGALAVFNSLVHFYGYNDVINDYHNDLFCVFPERIEKIKTGDFVFDEIGVFEFRYVKHEDHEPIH